MILLKKRVFIIEDNLANRAVMQMALEFEGAKTAVDRWGQDVIPGLINFMPVHIILLDLMFPQGVTGYDVFDQIHAEPTLKDIPIVAVSATDAALAIPQTQAKGFVGFIRKPVKPEKFPQQILAIINGEQIWEHS